MAQVKTAKFEISPDWEAIFDPTPRSAKTVFQRIVDAEDEIDRVNEDHLDTYRVFKAKDQKVRRRIRELEDGQRVILDDIDLIYHYIDDIFERLHVVEQPKEVEEVEEVIANTHAPVPRDEVGAAIEALNEALGFAKGWPQVNLGTLRRLERLGYVSGSVKDHLPL